MYQAELKPSRLIPILSQLRNGQLCELANLVVKHKTMQKHVKHKTKFKQYLLNQLVDHLMESCILWLLKERILAYSNGEKDQEETPLNCNSSFIYHLSIRGNQILKN